MAIAMSHGRRLFNGALAMASIVLCFAVLTGCGNSTGAQAPVTGKVMMGGQPVTGGVISFVPQAVEGATEVSGRPASGAVKADGSFSLNTNGVDDGAVIGKHRVTYSPPVIPWEPKSPTGNAPAPQPPKSPYNGAVPTTTELEVKPGPNDFTIELQVAGR